MNTASSETVHHRPHLTAIQRLAALLAWAVAGAIFLTVGWLVLEPKDPQGAVTLLGHTRSGLVWVQVAALAAVSAGLATAIAGRVLLDVGTFAAAVGLSAVSVQGGTASYLLWDGLASSTRPAGSLGPLLALESGAWFLIVFNSLLFSAVVYQWLYGSWTPTDVPSAEHRPISLWAGMDVPVFGTWISREEIGSATDIRSGFQHGVMVGFLAILAMAALSAGLYSRSIQHGQSVFVVAASVWIASSITHRFVPVRSALWSVLGVLILACGAFAWTALRPESQALPANIPTSHFLRVLPLQYVAVGTASAIATFWYASAAQPQS